MSRRRALIFDCDGVIADTERDGHRVAFNAAFAERGLDVVWDEALYGRLLQVAGGKERMRAYFQAEGWPRSEPDHAGLIAALHAAKSRIFQAMVADGLLPPRPGVGRLVDEAVAAGFRLAVCSTSALESVRGCVALLGDHRAARFDAILAGDMVLRKKPDPEIYELAALRLGADPRDCFVIEDSAIGCAAAVAARMTCVVTTSAYTTDEAFPGALLVLPDLGEGDHALRLDDIIRFAEQREDIGS